MSPQFLAAIGCPACGTRFQTPVEQVLDVRVDPAVKNRLLSGAVNMAVCPACGMSGALNLPFVYHDPEKQVALLYLPANVADNEVDRQKEAGKLTRQLMDSLPQEERKGYLLQPETFLNPESLMKRVLELENVSDADMQRSQDQRQFLGQFITAEASEWPGLLEAHANLLDETFFGLLEYTLQMVGVGGGSKEEFEKLQSAYDYLVEQTEVGQMLLWRSEVIRGFGEAPSIETLLKALADAQDEETVQILVQAALPMMDYAFFQELVRRIEAASGEDKERLMGLRRQIIRMRDEIAQAGQDLARARAGLLEKLLNTEEPLKMARSHRSELDDTFSFVLRSELDAAHKEGNRELFEALQGVVRVLNQVLEETMPPEAVLVRRMLMVPSDEHVKELLDANRQALTPYFFQFLEGLIVSSQEMGDQDSSTRLAEIRELAKGYAPESTFKSVEAAPGQPPELSSGSEQTTPSGLIIAKH